MIHMEEGLVLHYSTKSEADISIPSKVIRVVPVFGIGSRDPGHDHLGVVL